MEDLGLAKAETVEEVLKLRPYKAVDGEKIASWIKDELTLRRWSSDRFGAYHCYKAAGFTEMGKEILINILGEQRKDIELETYK